MDHSGEGSQLFVDKLGVIFEETTEDIFEETTEDNYR